eukprot:TRINITY_DN6795_c0_g1_i4.p1 TRINITY_DN6795_c0_g1~~TRINITY_DN6795_c0_g1_i4.p1  ORF type:complete len:246 (+),score=-0.04 TRINITY_DN6795_c0_g1_i4:430-1167(+)
MRECKRIIVSFWYRAILLFKLACLCNRWVIRRLVKYCLLRDTSSLVILFLFLFPFSIWLCLAAFSHTFLVLSPFSFRFFHFRLCCYLLFLFCSLTWLGRVKKKKKKKKKKNLAVHVLTNNFCFFPFPPFFVSNCAQLARRIVGFVLLSLFLHSIGWSYLGQKVYLGWSGTPPLHYSAILLNHFLLFTFPISPKATKIRSLSLYGCSFISFKTTEIKKRKSRKEEKEEERKKEEKKKKKKKKVDLT